MPGQEGKRPGQSLDSLLCVCHRDVIGIKLLVCAPTAPRASSYPVRPHTGWDYFLTSLQLHQGQHLSAYRARQVTQGRDVGPVGRKWWGLVLFGHTQVWLSRWGRQV